MSKRNQPTWQAPEEDTSRSKLMLYNSLTRRKEVFHPAKPNIVQWYSCGPTVYDASHMGHARSYISFDILRRVMSDYFGYNVQYVMNITDIDDKIIKRARQNFLYEKYVGEERRLEDLLDDYKSVLALVENKIQENTDADKKIMLENMLAKMLSSVEALTKVMADGDTEAWDDAKAEFLLNIRDPLSDWLDKQDGASVTDNSIFEALPRYWENEFHKDMTSLNILPPNCLTRVSEYVPQIVKYIERIIENKLAYEANGSVYFDVQEFDKRPIHHYAKLVPEAYGDTKQLQDGEGDLCTGEERLSEKRSQNDFALWKNSKAGEPWWNSPWGKGRPGWHIECSAMASDICGPELDIHTGGVDLKFPHHDNELAQSEAYYDNPDWVKYFLHTGHLTIAGCKMSKSLKNFVTIQQALKKHSACQLRLAFLLHSWKDTLDYSDNVMDMAVQFEKFLNEFFLNVKDLTRHIDAADALPSSQFNEWTTWETDLLDKLSSSKASVHNSLCNNIDTRTALEEIRDLVSVTNGYIRDRAKNINSLLLRRIAAYITDLLHIFGCIQGPRGGIGFPVGACGDLEKSVMPYITALAEFRHAIREQAKSSTKDWTNILNLCDALRDDVLPNLGVRLEDRETGTAAVKLVDRETLLKDRELKKKMEADKLAEKEKKKAEAAAAQAIKDAQKKINPKEMFLQETDKYSSFDDNGLPTLTNDGKEVSKGQIKKLQKLQQAQEKKYNEYLASVNGTST